MLSKSKYIRGINCQKSLWLYVHKKNERAIGEYTQAIFNTGTSVGELARTYFPNGKMAVLEDYPGYQSAKRTQEFIKQGAETIYEATFIFKDTLVAVDILQKEENGWHLFEVKSTNSTKSEHIKDVALQYYVVKGSGLPLENVSIMHFDREYVRRGDIDVKALFMAESVLENVHTFQILIPENIALFQEMLKGEEPQIEMGNQCISPYACDFCEYCSKFAPIPAEEVIELSSTPEINKDELQSFINSISYPLCHLDFETIMPAIPLFDESRPYQQLPFQYSLHFQKVKNGALQHTQYLAESNPAMDPRKELIKQLIEETKEAKTIMVYNIAFERLRLIELGRDFPEYAEALGAIIEKLVDLIIPFRQRLYRTENMEGSSSIKKVLPALCPEFSYDTLEIGNGMDASVAFLNLYYCDDDAEIAKTRKNLLEYCHLDTLAMVKILEVLEKV